MTDGDQANRIRAAIYCRVSTQEQALNGYSLGAQKEVCRKLAQDRGWLHRLYQDPGFTASNTERPAFQQMIQDALLGKFSAIIVYRLDRLSRSISDFSPLFDFLQDNDINLISISEPFIDTTSPWGRHNIYQMILYAQLEREIFRERSILGLRARVKEGKWRGGCPPFGYFYDKESGRLKIDNKEAPVVRLIFDKYLALQSLSAVKNHLNDHGIPSKKGGKWCVKVVRDVLSKEIYTGCYRVKDIEIEENNLRIIEDDTFQQVQDLLQVRVKYSPNINRRYSVKDMRAEELCFGCSVK